MNIEDWLNNANLRLENRSVSYAALATEDLPLALIMVRAALDECDNQNRSDYYGTDSPDYYRGLGDAGAAIRQAIENILKEYT